MIFLIDYNRRAGQIVSITAFEESARHSAEQARLALELELSAQGIEREIVLLEAANEQALHKTHRRYFEGLEGLAKAN